jgi:endonuclease/exonuclease/phosphatase family metal-dependent hydrolase
MVGCSSVQNIRSDTDTLNSLNTLTVMTFNIRHGCGTVKPGNTSHRFFKSCPKKYDLIVPAIRSVDPDVVGLQEVSIGQAGKIAKSLNMNYVFSRHNPDGYGGWWGNAVLSKFKILDSKKTAIGGAGGRNRSIVTAITLINGNRVAIISVHIDHRLADESSVRRIANYIDSISGPVVLTGDFNIQPWDQRLDLLRPRFVDTTRVVDSPGASEVLSNGTGKFFGRIDYVFSEVSSFKVTDVGLLTRNHWRASDHYAYWARLSLKTDIDDSDLEAPLAMTADGSLKPPEGAVQMKGVEIEAIVVGNSWKFPNNDGGTYFKPNGDTVHKWKSRKGSGQWYVEDNEICLYEKSSGGEWCYKFYKLNGDIVTYDDRYSEYVKVSFETGNTL